MINKPEVAPAALFISQAKDKNRGTGLENPEKRVE